ncbi:MAG: tyrosine-type recombinase/integrase [Bacilli bacterium]
MDAFKYFLVSENLAPNTVSAYITAVKGYIKYYDDFTKKNLLAWKAHLIENYKAKTVNLKIQAMNKYLEFIKKSNIRIKSIKVQQKPFLENVISDADYVFLKRKLKQEQNKEWYFIVRFLCATGARVSELIKIKVEHINLGYIDLYAKGGKIRRIYIPIALRKETIVWIKDSLNISSGYIFLNRFGDRITTRGISQQLKNYAVKFGIDPKVVYPHSFRHRFAKNFLDKYNDIALLADLMGHESIETTRIYLRKTASEQQAIVDKIVTW